MASQRVPVHAIWMSQFLTQSGYIMQPVSGSSRLHRCRQFDMSTSLCPGNSSGGSEHRVPVEEGTGLDRPSDRFSCVSISELWCAVWRSPITGSFLRSKLRAIRRYSILSYGPRTSLYSRLRKVNPCATCALSALSYQPSQDETGPGGDERRRFETAHTSS
jgi:hypothetical protein